MPERPNLRPRVTPPYATMGTDCEITEVIDHGF